MRIIPEQIRKTDRPAAKNLEAEKKTSRSPSETFAPECASAAAAEANRALGFALDAHSGSVLLSGGNQLLLSIMQNLHNETPEEAVNVKFSETSPENEFQPDGTVAETAVPEFTGQPLGMTDTASFI